MMKRLCFATALMLVAVTGRAQTQEWTVRDPATRCALSIRLPAAMAEPIVGKVRGDGCVNERYEGWTEFGWRTTAQLASGSQELSFARMGWMQAGRNVGLYMQAFLGVVTITEDGRTLHRFSKSDPNYSLQAMQNAVETEWQARPDQQQRFNLNAAKNLLRIFDGNDVAFVKYFSHGFSDDLKARGRSARGG